MKRISVAMATYNGEQYIEEQLLSIIEQLGEKDEVIVSDDGSSDHTCDIVKKMAAKYPQIRLMEGPCEGAFLNFFNAINHCKNPLIFLSDQDDIWMPNKVREVCRAFLDKKAKVVLHNGISFSEDVENLGRVVRYRKGFLKNWAFSSYWGCCMAFRKSFIKRFLPVTEKGIAHDQLIGLFAEKRGETFYLDQDLIKHRIHEDNQTYSRTLNEKIMFRIQLMSEYIKIDQPKKEIIPFSLYMHAYMPEPIKRSYRKVKDRKLIESFIDANPGYEENSYVKKSGELSVFPYEWKDEKISDGGVKEKGKDRYGVFYIYADNNKIYVPQKRAVGNIGKTMLTNLLKEQDERSPHRYFSEKVFIDENTVFFDCGAAEGLISQMYADTYKKAYLFECDEDWIPCLKRTMLPYKDKVSIVKKYVGSENSADKTDLVKYINKNSDDNIVIKMDIEGAEIEVVRSLMKKVGYKSNIRYTVCTYHNKDDDKILKELFEEAGYQTEQSMGYMIVRNPLEYRKGIIRAY